MRETVLRAVVKHKPKSNPMSTLTELEREKLPAELRSVFDQLVAEYRFHAQAFHNAPFVSPKVLAALVRDGWRPSGESQHLGS